MTLTRFSQEKTESDPAKLRDSLVTLERNCAADWLKRGDVQERFGLAYGEHGLFEEAGMHYELAAKSEDLENASSLRAIEQRINLEARFGGTTGKKTKIEQAIQRGAHLLALGETSERLNIMGSAHKRLAALQANPKDVKAALAKARDCYRRAAEKQEAEPLADPYPIVNWLAIEALLGNAKVPYESWLSKAEILGRQRFQTRCQAWDLFAIADIAVVRSYLDGSLPDKRSSLVETYERVFAESAATKRERDSARGQLAFLMSMRGKLTRADGDKKKGDAILNTLEAIIKHLERSENQRTGVAASPAASPSPSPAKPSPKRTTRRKLASKKPLRQPRRKKKQSPNEPR